MLLAVCPLVAALQTGFGRPGLVQPPAFSTGPARSARAAATSSARLPAAVSMVATDKSPVVDDLTKYYEGDSPLEDRMWDYVKKRGGDRLIRRILIANNGMAATKSIMSIRQWAYETFGDEKAVEFVVMATPEDLTANAEFIRRADEFVEVPGGSNANNYANVQLIVDLCLSQNVRPSLAPSLARILEAALRRERHASASTPLRCATRAHAAPAGLAGGRRHGRLGPRLREPEAGRHAQGAWRASLSLPAAPASIGEASSYPCQHARAAQA
tara:strand:- start:264 stop:1076 length:813 start_codon:yes stop_codon:yes gene_type:complete